MTATDAETNKNAARRLFEEVFPAADIDALRGLVAPDVVDHDPMPGQPTGVEGIEYVVTALHTAQPDQQFTVDQLFGEGDRVAVRWTSHGTNTGSMFGRPPTGQPVQHTAVVILRFGDHGKIVERWAGFSPS